MDEVVMPALGLAQDTGKVIRWLKRDGDAVSIGEALLEVETDKAAVEVEAVATGILANVAAAEGEIVPVGRRIAIIVKPGETIDEAETAAPPPPESDPVLPVRSGSEAPGTAERRVLASPKARRLAAERGIDLSKLAASEPGRILTASDLLAPATELAGASATNSSWQSMAQNVTRAWQSIPHIFLGRDVNADYLVGRHKIEKAAIPRLTLTDLVLEAVAAALVRHPSVNSGKNHVDLGVAVALDEALIVPVIHVADRLTLAELAEQRSSAVERARSQRLKAVDLSTPTFTVSNLGMYGIDFFTAIISEGQAGILAIGAVRERVVPSNGQVAIRPMFTVVASFDHRAVDGARGARFLETLARLIEGPEEAN